MRCRRWVIVVGGIVALLVVAVAVFAYLWSRSGARPVSVDEARRRFKSAHATPSAAGRFTPAEGVYTYRGTGSESLSSPPKSQSEGPVIPGTVTQLDGGCWSLRLDYSSNHWRRWKFCVRDDRLTEVANEVYQRWDFVVSAIDRLATMTCTPPNVILVPGPPPGTKWPASCSGTNSAIAGTTVSTGTHGTWGPPAHRVGEPRARRVRFHDVRAVSGAQTGTETFDFWLAADGLPLRGRQRIEVASDSPIGKVTYSQQSEFSLARSVPSS